MLNTEAEPYEPMSETAVLAACLRSQRAMKTAAECLAVDDFYSEQHREIWRVMLRFHHDGRPIDAGAVMIEAVKVRPALGAVVTNLVTTSLGAGDLRYHLARIEAAAIRRDLMATVQRAWQEATTSDEDPVVIAEDTIERLRVTQRMRPSQSTEVDVLDLIERVDVEEDWVIKDVLARMERLILTAPEGYGKSTFLRQLAACLASGLHPFRPEGIEARRVLVIDAENPEKINRTEYRRMLAMLDGMGHQPKPGMLTIEQCGPTNVLDGRTAAAFYAQVERLKPDLITIGPLYQLHEENPNDEGPARKLSAFLDRLRMINGSALITEAHTPHSDGPGGQMLRPYGASLWKRWPEFGLCLHPMAPPDKHAAPEERYQTQQMRESQLQPWRGNRATRRWPVRLQAGNRLPWMEM